MHRIDLMLGNPLPHAPCGDLFLLHTEGFNTPDLRQARALLEAFFSRIVRRKCGGSARRLKDLKPSRGAVSPPASPTETIPIRHLKHHTLISALHSALNSDAMRLRRAAWGRKPTRPKASSQGWVEEVDTGKGQRFCSKDELLRFLGECFSGQCRDPRTALFPTAVMTPVK